GFEPLAVELRYAPPRAAIDHRRDLGWMRRLWPLVRAHGGSFAAALAFGVVALGAQIAVPGVLRAGIDNALTERSGSLTPYVVALVALAAVRFVFGGLYRYGLFGTAYRFETD